jgi:hypothetical protein
VLSSKGTFFDCLESVEDRVGRLANAADQRGGGDAGREGAVAGGKDLVGEEGRGRRAVTGDVAGLARRLADELGTHVLVRILELDLLGDGDAVLGDHRAAPTAVEHRVAALGTHRRDDGACQLGHAVENGLAGLGFEHQLLGHDVFDPSWTRRTRRMKVRAARRARTVPGRFAFLASTEALAVQ